MGGGISLPIFITNDKDLSLLQTNWSRQINPLLIAPLNNGIFLEGIVLAIGDNVINHKLGHVQQGWFITDINAASSIYHKNGFNAQTFTLNSSAVATVNIFVF